MPEGTVSRPARPDRAVPDRRRAHRAAHRRADRAARDRPAPRSCTSAGGWPRACCRPRTRGRSWATRGTGRCRRSGLARGAGAGAERSRRASRPSSVRPSRRIHPGTVDPPGRRRPGRERLTWLFLRRGRLDRTDGPARSAAATERADAGGRGAPAGDRRARPPDAGMASSGDGRRRGATAIGGRATILRSSVLRRVELAFAAFNIAEWATWIAILVYAYRQGGAAATGLDLVPAARAHRRSRRPAASVYADRLPRIVALRGRISCRAWRCWPRAP